MKKITLVLVLLFTTAIAFYSCRKDEDSETPLPSVSNPNLVQATVTGIVLDENNDPLTGVAVSANGLSASTDVNGIFVMNGGIEKERSILQLSKPGYLNRLHAFIPVANTVNYVRIVLISVPLPQQISSSAGGTITMSGGASVQFQPNSFISASDSTPYSGTVSVQAKHLSVSNPNFGLMIPGGDLAGENTSGDEVALYSFGMVDVVLKSSTGELLQLATGSSATITFPIAASQQSTALSTIPLWHFEEATALWKEEGQATKAGTIYVAEITHFTTWNCDYQGDRAYVNGRVVDCEGVPVENVVVTIYGGVTVSTGQFGYYSTWVPAGWPLTFQVLAQGSIVSPSQLENVLPLNPGQTFTVPDLIVPCGSFFTGNLVNCENIPGPGTAVLYNNGVIISYQYTTTGSFRLSAPVTTNLSISLITSSGYGSQSVTSGNASDTIDLGDIQLCNEFSTSTSFVVNGAGFNYVRANFIEENNNEANYYVSADWTYCEINGISNIGAIDMNLNFQGNQPVSFDLSSTPDSMGFIEVEGQAWSSRSSVPFQINVTHFGIVGDSIKGNFSGTLFTSWMDSVGVEITDGKFAYLRGMDH